MIGRREFVVGIWSAAAWPLVARGQQPGVPIVGFLSAGGAGFNPPIVAAFRKGLSEGGYVERRNIEILFRYAEYRFDRLPDLASELVRHRVAVIVAAGAGPSLAAKAATSTIPIAFECAVDPVANGLVASLRRPGGNMTGVALLAEAFYAKGVGLLHELVPDAASIALLINPTNPANLGMWEAEGAARTLGLRLQIAKASTPGEIEETFSNFAQERIGGVIVNTDALFLGQRDLLVALAVRYRLPAVYGRRDMVQGGGLVSYGASQAKGLLIVGNYTARILKGERPADLPVQQSTGFELVINLKTAKALDLTIPETLLATADEVIQ